MPAAIIQIYTNKIINIHPVLLPRYGGKNIYGNRVHEAVIESRDKESGITIYFVDENTTMVKLFFRKVAALSKMTRL
ncbi:MAG: formyltransferase family protein [Ginsengibacter sp.]